MKSKVTYILRDTFNDCVISRHRSLVAAVRADRLFQRKVKRANGRSSYIPTKIEASDGSEPCDSKLHI